MCSLFIFRDKKVWDPTHIQYLFYFKVTNSLVHLKGTNIFYLLIRSSPTTQSRASQSYMEHEHGNSYCEFFVRVSTPRHRHSLVCKTKKNKTTTPANHSRSSHQQSAAIVSRHRRHRQPPLPPSSASIVSRNPQLPSPPSPPSPQLSQ